MKRTPDWKVGDRVTVTDKKSDKFGQFGVFIEFKNSSTGLRAVVEFKDQKQRSFLLRQIRYFHSEQVYLRLVSCGVFGSAQIKEGGMCCRIVAYPDPPCSVGFIVEDILGDHHYVRSISDLFLVSRRSIKRWASLILFNSLVSLSKTLGVIKLHTQKTKGMKLVEIQPEKKAA